MVGVAHNELNMLTNNDGGEAPIIDGGEASINDGDSWCQRCT